MAIFIGDADVGALLVVFVLFTVLGVIILLFACRNSHAGSSVSMSHYGFLSRTNDGPAPAAPWLLSSFGLGDPVEAIIWSSQMPALRFVCEREPQGALCADLKPLYVDLSEHYPEIYDGHTFRAWGQLLVDLDVFRVEAKRVHITRAGRALLDLLIVTTSRQTREFSAR